MDGGSILASSESGGGKGGAVSSYLEAGTENAG